MNEIERSSAQLLGVVHKATPADPSAHWSSCTKCKELVRLAPGGQGLTWVHDATGAVAGPGVHQHETESHPIVLIAADLLSDDGENPEYDRACTEIVSEFLDMPDKEAVLEMLRTKKAGA